MSEEKIIQHTKKAIHIATSKGQTWQSKLKGLAEEVGIIIFAVSITPALHNWNDQRNEHKMAREFLAGTSSDLKADAGKLDKAITGLTQTAGYYDTVWQQIISHKVNAAYVDDNSFELINTVYFSFDNGRFESFKSSGYLRLIENKSLLNHITNLFTSIIPFQVNADDEIYRERRADYNTYIGVKAPVDSNKVAHVSQILNDPAVRHQIVYYGNYLHERIRDKQELASQMRKLAAEIDRELGQ